MLMQKLGIIDDEWILVKAAGKPDAEARRQETKCGVGRFNVSLDDTPPL